MLAATIRAAQRKGASEPSCNLAPRLDRPGQVLPWPAVISSTGRDKPGAGCRWRRCLLKGCKRRFTPARPQARYCSSNCVTAAGRWRAVHVWGWSKYGRLPNLAAENTEWLRDHIIEELSHLQDHPHLLASFLKKSSLQMAA